MRPNTIEDFWLKVTKTEICTTGLCPTGCWLWKAGLNRKGYGVFCIGGRHANAHCWSYERLVGPVPDGLELDHLCRIRNCVNPDHLEPVTTKVNIMRGEGLAAKHAAATACPQGHAYDDANTFLYEGRRYCRECLRQRKRARRFNPEQHERDLIYARNRRAALKL